MTGDTRKVVHGSGLTEHEVTLYKADEDPSGFVLWADAETIAQTGMADRINAKMQACMDTAMKVLRVLGPSVGLRQQIKEGRELLAEWPIEAEPLRSLGPGENYCFSREIIDKSLLSFDRSEADDPLSLAILLFHYIMLWREEMEGEADPLVLTGMALDIGKTRERLFWKTQHEGAAIKGHKRIEHEREAQRTASKSRSLKAAQHANAIVRIAKKVLKEIELAVYDDTEIARRVMREDDCPELEEGTIRKHIGRARKNGVLPPRDGKMH